MMCSSMACGQRGQRYGTEHCLLLAPFPPVPVPRAALASSDDEEARCQRGCFVTRLNEAQPIPSADGLLLIGLLAMKAVCSAGAAAWRGAAALHGRRWKMGGYER
eukprot:TRINITY_DN48057_c0_g1_i1.p3 TRINITY_DN48057_c0_g1~~TRINITY_DN48057_c0_g1_i1.p3  ORF type:complete len:105 (+),score=16.22 TRINITY_DN48057_c0_g1_i1:523-837(+)